MSPNPLDDVGDTETILRTLGQALWSWESCAAAPLHQPCASSLCSCQRHRLLKRYHQYATRAHFGELAFPQLDDDVEVAQHDPVQIARAVSLIVKVILMLEPSPIHLEASDRVEKGSFKTGWRSDIPFSQYVQGVFPVRNHPVLSHTDNGRFSDMRWNLRAVKLKELGVIFRPTDDIQNHLRFNRKENILEVFHHTAFLKEQLRATKTGGPHFSDPSASIAAGSLPRQLVLEVLDSIQAVLFPLSDKRSNVLLRSLVRSCSFDPDVLNFEFRSIRNQGEEKVGFVYLADRLSDLHNELESPPPRGWFERMIERKSGARYMMMATLIGVVFAVILGLLSLAVGSYQAWITYQAWQHPRSPGS